MNKNTYFCLFYFNHILYSHDILTGWKILKVIHLLTKIHTFLKRCTIMKGVGKMIQVKRCISKDIEMALVLILSMFFILMILRHCLKRFKAWQKYWNSASETPSPDFGNQMLFDKSYISNQTKSYKVYNYEGS